MSNSTSTTATSNNDMFGLNPLFPSISSNQHDHQHKPKKQRNQPGNPDPEAEVVALSPKTLMTTNRFVCEICNKGFQRDQNLQLHRRGHNLPWKLRQKSTKEGVRKRVYVCPEPTCVHNHPSRALGDLTGIKKHFYRKHGEKVWKCDKCCKKYAVMSDWKAHTKTCGTREYRCDCGTLFSRKDSFITHRAFCDALAEESARLFAATTTTTTPSFPFSWNQLEDLNPNPNLNTITSLKTSPPHHKLLMATTTSCDNNTTIIQPQLSATALLQKASTIGSIPTTTSSTSFAGMMSNWHAESHRMTRDFLGVVVPAGGGQDELLFSGLGLEFAYPSPCDHNTTSSTTTARIGFTPRMWGDC